jgi:hypothetical protein
VATKTTKGEREELLRYSRRREAVAVEQAKARSETLLAEVEQQLAMVFKSDDDAWKDVMAETRAIVAEANAHVKARCREAGIPESVAPGLNLVWESRGENILKERRAELRKVAKTRLDAEQRRAIAIIKEQCVEFEGLVLAGGLESEAAKALLTSMPTVDVLMPPLDVAALQSQIPSLPDLAKRYADDLNYRYMLDRGSGS